MNTPIKKNQAYEEILSFWFIETSAADRFKKNHAFDQLIKTRFCALYHAANAGELFSWRAHARGRLAEIIVLDQFPRNMWRESAAAFAADALALVLAQEAITHGEDAALTQEERHFMYLPFMHSESKIIHEISMELFIKNGAKEAIKYARQHKNIIDQFGRYPHRNAILGRKSTPKEVAFLQRPDAGF